jgi:hypothetical protein
LSEIKSTTTPAKLTVIIDIIIERLQELKRINDNNMEEEENVEEEKGLSSSELKAIEDRWVDNRIANAGANKDTELEGIEDQEYEDDSSGISEILAELLPEGMSRHTAHLSTPDS